MVFNNIYKKKYFNWHELEEAIEGLETTKEKGDAFEQFVFAYFVYYSDVYQIKELYMGPDIPESLRKQYKIEKKDSGVDGMIIKEDGSSVAYQVKFRTAGKAPSYNELTSFWAESEYCDERCIIANSINLPKQTFKKKSHFNILRNSLMALDEDFYLWLYEYINDGKNDKIIKKYKPKEHQKKMINEVVHGFENADRGKMLAACGTGKTLTALWIKEEMKVKKVLFVAPNLALIKQTLESWMPQAKEPFAYICVCSDATVAINNLEDELIEDISYIDVPVTTDPKKIIEFIEYDTNKDKVIFSTYQSLDSVVSAMQDNKEFTFDIAFFDEAHRTAGSKDSDMFVFGMSDNYIRCKKRLFMTATERFVSPRIVGRAQKYNYEVFSMDNEEQYGKTLTALPFRKAIDEGIISDYKIVLCCMCESEIKRIIENNDRVSIGDRIIDARTMFKQILLAKTMGDIGINKVITYHSNIETAKEFIKSTEGISISEVISDVNDNMDISDIYVGHINGSMKAGERKEIFEEFIQSPIGVISNARCLTEGIDVPIIDAVYFADPKNSIVDIIQAVGRSLRKDTNNPDKVSYIIIPVIISDDIEKFEDIDPQEFSTLHAVIQALRDQDRILADFIDQLNLKYAKGKHNKHQFIDAPIVIELPENMKIDDFSEGLSLRIAEINKDPSNIGKEYIIAKASRTSGVKRTFRTVGDYNIDAYYNNLVLPTLEKYDSFSKGLSRADITINHNNVSHCIKIGALIEKNVKYYATDMGKAMFEYRKQYLELFKEQMLKYYELDSITHIPKFPYRMFFRVIAYLKYITRFEFVYSLYIGKNFGTIGEQEAIDRVSYLRETYPNIEVLNESNKKIVLEMLNLKYDTTLTYEDIWTSRTTVYNQFNYILKHLLIWDDIFDKSAEKNEIRLLPDGEEKINMILDKSSEIENCPLDSLKNNFIQYKGY